MQLRSVPEMLDAADELYEHNQSAKAFEMHAAAIEQAEKSVQQQDHRVNAYFRRARIFHLSALQPNTPTELKEQHLKQAEDDYAQVLTLDPSKAADIKKQKFIHKKIFEEYFHFKREDIARTHGAVAAHNYTVNISHEEHDSAALLYQLEEWKETKRQTKRTEILAVQDDALTRCPYHTDLLKSCIELTKQELAEAKETAALTKQLEKYYSQLLTHERVAQHYFALGLLVAKDLTRSVDALATMISGIKCDLPKASIPAALRSEVAACVFKLQHKVIVRKQIESNPLDRNETATRKIEQYSRAITEFRVDHIDSQCFHDLINSLDDDRRFEHSLLCAEICVWLIITGQDKKSKNQKILSKLLNRLAQFHMLAIPECLTSNAPTAALIAFQDWLRVLEQFRYDQSRQKSTDSKLSSAIIALQDVETLFSTKEFVLAYENTNTALVAYLSVSNIASFIRTGTQLFVRHLCEQAAQSFDKPAFGAIIDILKKMQFDEATLKQFVHSQIDMLKTKARQTPVQRWLDEGYTCYCNDQKDAALEILTKVIKSREHKVEPPATPNQMLHAHVLRNLTIDSQSDQKAALEINEPEAKAAFYAYRRLKVDAEARRMHFHKFFKYAAFYVDAREAAERKDFKNATQFINKALEIYPGNDEAWLQQGRILSSANNENDAIKSFTRSIKCQPKQVAAYFERASIYSILDQPERGKALEDFFTGVRNYNFNPNFLDENVIADGMMAFDLCHDHFIAEHRDDKDIVKITEKIKSSFPNCVALLIDRAQLWQRLKSPIKAVHDLQFSLFLIKVEMDETPRLKSFHPIVLNHLISILLDGDKDDLQNALDQLRAYNSNVAEPDADEYKLYLVKKSEAEHKNHTHTRRLLAPPKTLGSALELKSLLTHVERALASKKQQNLLKAKADICQFISKYTRGDDQARVFADDINKLFNLCMQLNAILPKQLSQKEIKETKSADIDSVKTSTLSTNKPNDAHAAQLGHKAKKNQKKKTKRQETDKEKQRIVDEIELACPDEAIEIRRQEDDIRAQLQTDENYEAEQKNEAAILADEKFESDRRADEEAAAERLAEEETVAWSQIDKEIKAQKRAEKELRKYDEIMKEIRKLNALDQLARKIAPLLPAHLVEAMHLFQKNGARAAICGGQLRQAIRKAKGLPLIQGAIDSDFIIGLRTRLPAKMELSIKECFPGAHVFRLPNSDKDGYNFRVKYPINEVNGKFIYAESHTTDVRVDKILSDFTIPEEEALARHGAKCDITQGAIFYNGKLHDTAVGIGKSSGITDIEQDRLERIKEFKDDPLLVFRLIYKSAREEGNISLADIEIIKKLTPEYFASLKPGVINHWLKKILCYGNAVISLFILKDLKLLNKLFPLLPIDHPTVIDELMRQAIRVDQYYKQRKMVADFDEIYAELIMAFKKVIEADPEQKVTEIDPHAIKEQNALLRCNFEIYRNDPAHCLRTLRHYQDESLQIPPFIQMEIDRTVHSVNTTIIANLINGDVAANFNRITPWLAYAFKDLALLLNQPQIKKLVLGQLRALRKYQGTDKLQQLYAFWIVIISNSSIPTRPLSAVKNTNLFFQTMFPEPIEAYKSYFDREIRRYTQHAINLHGGGVAIPDRYLLQFAAEQNLQSSHAFLKTKLAAQELKAAPALSVPPQSEQKTADAPTQPPVTGMEPKSKWSLGKKAVVLDTTHDAAPANTYTASQQLS